ncbi:DegT/DnrJ/EryC1/StrS family aminotransferase [Herbaspirillum seropedicae]|uniref:Pyridoxal phosphate-dependent aminotransferase protein n=1 Tax=Herbaspirillum seropedicae (strain SmR1) TaxID=757424 RepID=D8IZL2_HERSS|nr:DegT/DnrJ/EryC1/StrS family aminotransferase [Herbaspirillum seropedicae]ADJ64352.1 pyridoxal phosphate-dependent aminotransferase protein [Herbaspirillum seropedicae SmR1]AKN66288.1 aminotransferase DegT [Herbaspirillum seropedicae]NQE30602.1 aminotransferase DegT [Herbaspirillum seropedicae]UMU22282.1 DegT/DnrJ/EryC1/StrS family aminotransferase [Herbaspirillum seropedicae]
MEQEWIKLSDPDVSTRELEAVTRVLVSSGLSAGPVVESFENEFASYLGRTYGVAAASGTVALMLALRAMGIRAGDEVIASAYSWHQIVHAITLVGATPVFADIDYWSGNLAPHKVADKISQRTRAIVVGNCNGHPAAWTEFRQLAQAHGLRLIEDSSEAIGSRYQGRVVGNFGDIAIFDFSQPSALCCGEGAMLVTDDPELASELHYMRNRNLSDRQSIAVASRVPMQGSMSDLSAAIGIAQLERLDEILMRRKQVEAYYLEHVQFFEGIKPPYIGPDVEEVYWMLYLVHLGTRFTRTMRNQIIEDLASQEVEAAAWCQPLHQQFYYSRFDCKRGDLLLTEKIADRCIALPLHGHLNTDEVHFIVQAAKDASSNVGAGAAIY